MFAHILGHKEYSRSKRARYTALSLTLGLSESQLTMFRSNALHLSGIYLVCGLAAIENNPEPGVAAILFLYRDGMKKQIKL